VDTELGTSVLAQKLMEGVTDNRRPSAVRRTPPDQHPSASMSAQQQLQAVAALPPRLVRFFQRYPPPALFPSLAVASPTAPPSSTTPPSDPSALVAEASAPQPPPVPSTAPRNSRIPAHAHALPYPNPFLPSKNFATGRWHGPALGLRKQADLVKLAVQHDVVDLLPWTIKKPGEKEARRIESGLMVKGTGEGQKVKGKSWERTLKGRLEMRRQAMLNMPQMIQEWKQVSSPRKALRTHTPGTNESPERTWSWMEEVAKRACQKIACYHRGLLAAQARTLGRAFLCGVASCDFRTAFTRGVWGGFRLALERARALCILYFQRCHLAAYVNLETTAIYEC
jgi:large subunit ribosomal protein L25